eukprot:767597-Hanusia_phi.AAC.2
MDVKTTQRLVGLLQAMSQEKKGGPIGLRTQGFRRRVRYNSTSHGISMQNKMRNVTSTIKTIVKGSDGRGI